MKFWVDFGKWVFQPHDGKFCFSKKSIMEVEKSYCRLSSKHLMNSLKKAKQSFCMPHKDISYHDFFYVVREREWENSYKKIGIDQT